MNKNNHAGEMPVKIVEKSMKSMCVEFDCLFLFLSISLDMGFIVLWFFLIINNQYNFTVFCGQKRFKWE